MSDLDRALVARDAELCEVENALAEVDDGRAALLDVTGEPGIGKTRLLDEVSARATARGHLVLRGLASEQDRTLPFGVLLDALADRVPALLPAGRETPSHRETAAGGADRFRIYLAACAELAALGGGRPVTVILDDLHWADSATVEFLAYLLRHPPRLAVLLAVAHRPRQTPVRLLAVLADAATRPGARHLGLGPLTPAQTATLLGTEVSRNRCHALHAASGGNPGYLLVLARTGGSAVGRRIADGVLPAAVRAALHGELAALDPASRRVADAAAVAGDPFEPWLLAEVAGIGIAEALTALDWLVERDLVRPVEGGERFRFRHPLVRQIAYEICGAGWRLAAHQRAATALDRRGASVVSRAHHVQRAARPGDLAAVALLREAATQALARAPALAAHWLEAAVRLLPADPPDRAAATPVDLLIELARARGVAGQVRAGHDAMREALRRLPAGEYERRTAAVTFCAAMARLLGQHAEARAMLLQELATRPDRAGAGTAALHLELAAGSFMRADFAANHTYAQRALSTAKRRRDRPVQATALGFLAAEAFAGADVRRAARRLDEAAALVDAMPDHQLVTRIDAALWLGWHETYLERFGDALRHLERGLALARGAGQGHLLTLLLASHTVVLRWLGRLPEATASAEEAVDAAELTGSDELRTIALAMRCWIATWTGEIDLAMRAGADAVTAAGRRRGWFAGLATAMFARARVFAGQATGCVALIVDQFGGPELSTVDPWSRATWYELLVRAELAQGRVAGAAEWAQRARANAERLGLAAHTGLALLSEAHVLAAGASAADAAARARAAADAFGRAGCPLDAGRALLLAGGTLDRPAAVAALHEATALFDACGARALRDAAVRERRRTSARGPRPSVAEPELATLTPREREIAELVTEGLTNQEIASKLYVTRKTVEMHLSHVFAKLGVTTRAGVARRVTAAGRLPG